MAQDYYITLKNLRNNINFASVSQFFHTFHSAFRPWPYYADSYLSILYPQKAIKYDEDYVFATEDLEHMLLDPSQYHRLEELMVRMLRLLTRNRFINTSTWETYLSREYDKRQLDKPNPLVSQVIESKSIDDKDSTINNIAQPEKVESSSKINTIPFFSLSLETKLELLNDLCEWQLDEPERLREHLDHEDDAVQWRVEPIGYDRKGNSYWLFDDNRLYKESKPLKKSSKNKRKRKPVNPIRRNTRRSAREDTNDTTTEEPEYTSSDGEENWLPWKLVCMTVNDWNLFPQKFSKSTNSDEQYFYQLLINDVLPKVIPVIEENDKVRKKHEAIASRKRSSRLIVREIEALERQQMGTDSFGGTKSEGLGEEITLSRSEKRRLENEMKEKERKAKEREERLLERERKQLEKIKAEEQAAEKARLERERRLQRRTGNVDVLDDSISMTNNEVSEDHYHNQQESSAILQQGHHRQGKKMKKKKSTTKKSQKEGKNESTGKRKRGRKPKSDIQYEEDENWVFNCICGVVGNNLDDGTPMIACEKCNEWQHIKCLCQSKQLSNDVNNLEEISFTCQRCIDEEDKVDIDIDDVTDDERPIKKQNTLAIKSGFYSTFSIEQTDNYTNRILPSSTLPPIPPLRLTLHKTQSSSLPQLPQQSLQQQHINNDIYSSSSSMPPINNNQSIMHTSGHQTLHEANHSPKVTIINKVPTNVSSFRHTVQPPPSIISSSSSSSSSTLAPTSSTSSSFSSISHSSLLDHHPKINDDILNSKIYVHNDYNSNNNNNLSQQQRLSSSNIHHQHQHQYFENQMEPTLLGNHTRHYDSLDPSAHSIIQHSLPAPNIPITTISSTNNSNHHHHHNNNSMNI